jgi:dihydropyrimidinase
MYMTYPAMMIGDEAMYKALRKMKELGGIVGVHCENAGVIDALIAEKKAAGELSPASHPQCRPAILEAEAISRLLKMAELADVPVVIVHLSSAEGLREVEAARSRGQKVYVETCPHYLLLQDDLYSLPEFEGAKYVCAPPLRKDEDNDALWEALENGAVQTIATDHCSFTLAQKDAGREDFTKIPGGMPGVETRGVLLYTYGVLTERISAQRMAELLSEAPAKLYGVYPRKGHIAVGADADIVVYDPEGIRRISAKDQVCAADYAPYEGYELSGHISQVWLRGTLAVKEGEILVEKQGKYIPRRKCCL